MCKSPQPPYLPYPLSWDILSLVHKAKYLTQKLLVRILNLTSQQFKKNYVSNNLYSRKERFSCKKYKFVSTQDYHYK